MFRRLNHCHVPNLAPLCMDVNHGPTIANGFKKRVLRTTPFEKMDKSELTNIKEFVGGVFCPRYLHKVTPWSFWYWIDHKNYPGPRKAELIEKYLKMCGALPNRKQRRSVKCFGKLEPYMTYKHPRLIMSRTDEFKTFSGPMFSAIEEMVYELPWFIKHIPVPDRPALVKKLKKYGIRYFQTDFTAFESHFHKEIMEAIEFEIYRYCLPEGVETDVLLETLSGENVMTTRCGVTCRTKARRMSGETCTSLGNGLTNLILAMYIVHKKGGKLEGFVEGDDGLFATDVEITEEDYAKLGFTIKISEVADPCEASFCGLIFSESGEIVRDPYKFCATFGWTSSFIDAGPKVMDQLLRAKALSTLYETPQCPIVGAIARYALNVTEGVVPRFVSDGYHVPRDVVNVPSYSPSSDTRNLFQKLFGVSPEYQKILEKKVLDGDFKCLQDIQPPLSSGVTQSDREAAERDRSKMIMDMAHYLNSGYIVKVRGAKGVRASFTRVTRSLLSLGSILGRN